MIPRVVLLAGALASALRLTVEVHSPVHVALALLTVWKVEVAECARVTVGLGEFGPAFTLAGAFVTVTRGVVVVTLTRWGGRDGYDMVLIEYRMVHVF